MNNSKKIFEYILGLEEENKRLRDNIHYYESLLSSIRGVVNDDISEIGLLNLGLSKDDLSED